MEDYKIPYPEKTARPRVAEVLGLSSETPCPRTLYALDDIPYELLVYYLQSGFNYQERFDVLQAQLKERHISVIQFVHIGLLMKAIHMDQSSRDRDTETSNFLTLLSLDVEPHFTNGFNVIQSAFYRYKVLDFANTLNVLEPNIAHHTFIYRVIKKISTASWTRILLHLEEAFQPEYISSQDASRTVCLLHLVLLKDLVERSMISIIEIIQNRRANQVVKFWETQLYGISSKKIAHSRVGIVYTHGYLLRLQPHFEQLASEVFPEDTQKAIDIWRIALSMKVQSLGSVKKKLYEDLTSLGHQESLSTKYRNRRLRVLLFETLREKKLDLAIQTIFKISSAYPKVFRKHHIEELKSYV